MIRLVACDLDETLLDDEKNIPLRNREAISAFECAGRYLRAVHRPHLYRAGSYAETAGGRRQGRPLCHQHHRALITENTGRICASQGVDPQKALELTRYARENGMGIELVYR